MQIVTTKIAIRRTLYVHVALHGVILGLILYDIVPYTRDFLPVKFSFKYYFNKLFFRLPRKVTWPMNNARDHHKYRHKWGTIGPSYVFCEHSAFFLIVFFETVLGREHSKKVQKNSSPTFIYEESP